VAVSSALIADGRTWPLAFDPYPPTSWTKDAARCAAAGIPATVRFRQKWRIALAQVRLVLQAGFTITGVVVDAAVMPGVQRLLRRQGSDPSDPTAADTCAEATPALAGLAAASVQGQVALTDRPGARAT